MHLRLKKLCPTLNKDTEIVINCSGRGDKDVNTVASLDIENNICDCLINIPTHPSILLQDSISH